MSCWTKAQCNTLSDISLDFLEEALLRMGLYADFGTKNVQRVYEGDSRPCQALLRNVTDNSSARIGLNFTITADQTGKERVTMTTEADWWGLKYDSKSFMDHFTIEYNAAKAIATARSQGFAVHEETDLEDGRRRLVLVRAA